MACDGPKTSEPEKSRVFQVTTTQRFAVATAEIMAPRGRSHAVQTLQSRSCVGTGAAVKYNGEAGKAWNRSGRQRRGPKRAVSASTPGAATSSSHNGSVRGHCFLWRQKPTSSSTKAAIPPVRPATRLTSGPDRDSRSRSGANARSSRRLNGDRKRREQARSHKKLAAT